MWITIPVLTFTHARSSTHAHICQVRSPCDKYLDLGCTKSIMTQVGCCPNTLWRLGIQLKVCTTKPQQPTHQYCILSHSMLFVAYSTTKMGVVNQHFIKYSQIQGSKTSVFTISSWPKVVIWGSLKRYLQIFT